MADGRADLRSRRAWIRTVTADLAPVVAELRVDHAGWSDAQVIAAVSPGGSSPYAYDDDRPRCEVCDHHLDIEATCALALYGECPHGREAPR